MIMSIRRSIGKKKSSPHAYVHRSHVSGASHHTYDAHLSSGKGVLFLRNGVVERGKKKDVFKKALLAYEQGKLEAFAILDDNDGLLLSRGTADTSVAVHGEKHPHKQKIVYLNIPDQEVEYHGVWEESEAKMQEHNIRENMDNWLQELRKGGASHV